ncbi:polyhydroxyalkanoate biosynthesis repressor PhaR [Bacillus sp. 1P10SD]|uniref:polyhydroxyalkanoate biosynthesis repressor PhaR n=1 Tax=Bacillus sp. 1P10SD TaxID=3132265 RepID=UPI0039A4CDEF
MSEYQHQLNPYVMFKKYSDQLEKQMNDAIHLWTNNQEFVQFSRVSSDSHARFMEVVKKYNEFIANQLNLPSKNDLANVAKLAIQSEEKLETLEEQLWSLQDSVDASKRDIADMLSMTREVMKLVKQQKTENAKIKKVLEETEELKVDLQQLRNDVASITSLKEEIALLKELMYENLVKQSTQEVELSGPISNNLP